MRKLLAAILLALLLAGAAWGAPTAAIASAAGTTSASGTTLDCSAPLNVAAGDIIVAVAAWEDGASVPSIATTAADNALTMLATTTDNKCYIALGYKLATTANATATFRLTNGTARGYRSIGVWQFRPSGSTVTLVAGPSGHTGNSASMVSGSITVASGDDVIVVGGVRLGLGLHDRAVAKRAASVIERMANREQRQAEADVDRALAYDPDDGPV